MPEHTPVEPQPSTLAAEPCACAELARLIVAGLAALGILNFDSTTLSVVTGIVGGVLSIVLTVVARKKVTPLAKPRTDSDMPLAPLVAKPPPPGTAAGPDSPVVP